MSALPSLRRTAVGVTASVLLVGGALGFAAVDLHRFDLHHFDDGSGDHDDDRAGHDDHRGRGAGHGPDHVDDRGRGRHGRAGRG